MSLLDNASLLLTPNAYKEGKLYSVIPSNGNGDFTATRATTATRVNSAGLVDLVPYNLLSYSEQFENAFWTKGNSSTIASNTTTSPNGTLTADKHVSANTTSAFALINITQSVISGIVYTFSAYVKRSEVRYVQLRNNLNGNLFCNFDLELGISGTPSVGLTSTITNEGNGWYRCTISATCTASSSSGAFGFNMANSLTDPVAPLYAGNGVNGYFIWGAQLVEGTSARDYLRTETRLNIPRVDYSLGGCPNILLEPQRTNLILQSSSFDNTVSWSVNNAVITANSTTSPSGVVDAETIADNAVSSAHVMFGAVANRPTSTSGTTYTYSIFIKAGTRQFVGVGVGSGGSGGSGVHMFIDTTTFTTTAAKQFGVNTNWVYLSNTITSLTNGWYRVTLTFRTDAVLTLIPSVFLSNVSTSALSEPIYIGNGSTAFLWGAQLEAGAYSTSFIPTTTASVTRNADTITRNNIFTNGLITAAGGTWFVELRNNVSYTRDSVGGIWIGDNTTAGTLGNTLVIRNGGASQRQSIGKTISGSFTFLFTTTTDTCKIAIKWNGSTADIFQNGVKVVAATAFTPTNMDFLVGNGIDVPKYINEMALFPTPLTDAQCLALTA